jgi:hypothetical protein
MTQTLFTIPVIRGIDVNPLAGGSASITVYAYDSGIMFLNHYTTNTTYTLPAVADGKGKMWWFMNANTTSTLAITAPAAIMVCNDNATSTTNTCAADAGSWAMVVGDGTNYFCFEGSGTWTAS